MSVCIQCFIVVSKECPHCRELLRRAKDAVELLLRRGVAIINIEDFPDLTMLEDVRVGEAGISYGIPTPQFVCTLKDGDVWRRIYRAVILSPEQFHEERRFLEAKVTWLKNQYGRICFERRGRKTKEEKTKEEVGKKTKRRKQVVEEET
jgi:hypothetical protein